jgi:hypothetical protein
MAVERQCGDVHSGPGHDTGQVIIVIYSLFFIFFITVMSILLFIIL